MSVNISVILNKKYMIFLWFCLIFWGEFALILADVFATWIRIRFMKRIRHTESYNDSFYMNSHGGFQGDVYSTSLENIALLLQCCISPK